MKKLTASDAQASDRFGNSVAVSGDTAVEGAHRAGGANAGAAYVFQEPCLDTDGDTLCDDVDSDDDNDGCTDKQENGPNQALGGRRNPHYFWDFVRGGPFSPSSR